jgi:hypothetical protein
MSGFDLAIHRGGAAEKIRLDNAAVAVDRLADGFGINVDNAGHRKVLEARIDKVSE